MFINHYFLHKGRLNSKQKSRMIIELNRTYLKFFRNTSGDSPVYFLKYRIK